MQEKADTMTDVMVAIRTLGQLSHCEDDDSVEMNVGEVRNCFELMLALLEVYEGVDVAGMEGLMQMVAQQATHVDTIAMVH